MSSKRGWGGIRCSAAPSRSEYSCGQSRFDPFLQQRGIRGLEHGARGEEEIWREFAKRPEALAFEIPWAEDKANRLNPRNGLCLNALHDRAFDRRLMWIDTGIVIRLSPKLREANRQSATTVDWLMSFDGKPLVLPKNFQPDAELLARHASRCVGSR